jgi:hypothetical protein
MAEQSTDRERGGVKRFTLRDILLLFVVVALALGWWMDRRPRPVRFEMQANDHHVYILDTSTGQMWAERIEKGRAFPSNAEIHRPKLPQDR